MTKDEQNYYTWPAVRQLISQLEADSSQWGRSMNKLLESSTPVDFANVELARMGVAETNARLHELRQLLGYWEETHHSTRISLPI